MTGIAAVPVQVVGCRAQQELTISREGFGAGGFTSLVNTQHTSCTVTLSEINVRCLNAAI